LLGHAVHLEIRRSCKDFLSQLFCFSTSGEGQRKFENLRKRYSKKRALWKKPPKSGSGSNDEAIKRVEKLRKAYAFLAWLEPYIALRSTKTNLSEEMEEVEETQQDEKDDDEEDENEDGDDESTGDGDENEREGDEFDDISDEEDTEFDIERNKKNQSTSSTTSEKKETKSVAKRKIPLQNDEPKGGAKKKKVNGRAKAVEMKELALLESLQNSIVNKKGKSDSNSQTCADDLFGKMVGEDIKTLPPIFKLQARNEIQNVIFKYRMASMQDSLQRKLSSTNLVDGSHSPAKMSSNNMSNNLSNMYQNQFSPNSSGTSSSTSNHWIHSMNSYDFS